MIRASKKNEAEILNFIPSMKANMVEWQIITAKLPKKSGIEQEKVINKLIKIYEQKEGILIPVKDYKIVMVIRLGIINNYGILKKELEDKIPEHKCRVIARKMNAMGLKQIQIDLTDKKDDGELSLYEERDERRENVFLVCDDDMFVRKSLAKMLSAYGTVHEVDSGEKVCEKYLECNPDIVLLDIHMPGKDGLEIINDVIDMDTDAFIIMISADSSKENVLEAISCGSVGFLSKPVKTEKLAEFRTQCITYRQ